MTADVLIILGGFIILTGSDAGDGVVLLSLRVAVLKLLIGLRSVAFGSVRFK